MHATVILRKGAGRSFKAGGPWIFDNEADTIEGEFENGDIVSVRDFDGFFLGFGFINAHSKILVRILSRHAEHPVDDALLEMRVRDAWAYRKAAADTGCCRVIFGEADFLPGLTVDKFEDILVMECMSAGMDRLKDKVLQMLVRVLSEDGIHIRGIYERSEGKDRLKEGLPPVCGFIGEPFDTDIQITENGVRYRVDVKEGQKTGFFLDQKYNRQAVARLCRDKDVLDCFTHTGSFGLNAAAAGARSVLAVDASEAAIACARENAAANHVEDRMECMCADVFDLLPRLEAEGRRFDVVILDPPAFTKSRASIKNAVRGYREINLRGMKLVKNGGFLATCSCSHFMDPDLFARTIAEAARGAHRRLRQVEFRTQACDHPILWGDEASYYLKFYIFQVVDEI